MTVKENLARGKAYQFTSGEKQAAIARKGGQARTPNKQAAAKVRQLRKMVEEGDIEDPVKKILVQMMESGSSARLKILELLAPIMILPLTDKERRELAPLLLTWSKQQHGEAATTNVNIDLSGKHAEAMREYQWHNEAVCNVLQEKAPELLKDIYHEFMRLKNKSASRSVQ